MYVIVISLGKNNVAKSLLRSVPFYLDTMFLFYFIPDEISRDYQSAYTDPKLHEIMMYPWDHDRIDLDNIKDDWIERYTEQLEQQVENESNGLVIKELKTSPPYKVYSDGQYRKHITNENFEVVENKDDADIIYMEGHYQEME